MSKENFYDENGNIDFSMVCAARKGDLAMREFLYNNVDKKAYLECVLDLASSKVEGATEAIIKRGDMPECWDALWILAQLHNDLATEYILNNTLREGGLTRAITLAERADPVAKEYIRDFAGLIRFSDKGVPNATSVLYAHKDYNLECRERILHLCRKVK